METDDGTGFLVVARTDIEPAPGWFRLEPGVIALEVPLALCDHRLPSKGEN